MPGPIFSPDGKFLWTGDQWIPAPPEENILEESELDESIIETVSSETNIDPEELAETAVHFDLNEDKKIDQQEVEIAAKSLSSEIIPFDQWKSENDKPKDYDEENNIDKSITSPPIPFNQWENKEVTDIVKQYSERLMRRKVKTNALPKKNKFIDYISELDDIKKIVIAIGVSSFIMIIILLLS